jgi:hypothetical protein
MKKLAYFYTNPYNTKDLDKSKMFEGERIISKVEDVKFEDEY